MARHRDVKNLDIHAERSVFEDIGHSYDDGSFTPMSPSVADYIYNRHDKSSTFSDFVDSHDSRIDEEDVDDDHGVHPPLSESPMEGFFPESHPDSAWPSSSNSSKVTNGTNANDANHLSWSTTPPKPQRTISAKVESSPQANAGDVLPPSHVKARNKGGAQSAPQPVGLRLSSDGVAKSPEPEALSRLKITSANNSRSASPDPSSKQTPVKQRLTARPADSKASLSLVVAGHVDAGKSTLMGHLLYLLGNVNQKAMHKYRHDAQKMGKASFAYAWVLDETDEERRRGVTMDVAQQRFSTGRTEVMLLDAPGHKDFIPNMITGAAQADAALLIVNATTGEFETGFDQGGQTREHAMLIRTLGISQLAVVVNKLDTVGWAKSRFDQIVNILSLFLKQAGFPEVPFVPACGMGGENLTEPPPPDCPLSEWYQGGPTVIDIIDKFETVERNVDKPLRLCISDVFKSPTSAGFLVSGKLQTGALQTGDRVVIMPNGETGAVKGIQTDGSTDTKAAFAGDQVTLLFAGTLDLSSVGKGHVICHPETALKPVTKFEARLIVFNVIVPITRGFPVVIHYQACSEPAVVSKLISQLDRKTGELKKQKPRCLTKNMSAIVQVSTERPICIERYDDARELGRVTLRANGVTVAAGMVTKLL